jgi:hypothetical protein
MDVGCGTGGMKSVAETLGLNWIGIDGDPNVICEGIIQHDFLYPVTFTLPFSPDLVWCVEFVEHVEEQYIHNFLPLLASSKWLILSAAPPGKGGIHHVNCQSQDYWIQHLKSYGMEFDEVETCQIRTHTTMKREFIRDRGLVFKLPT